MRAYRRGAPWLDMVEAAGLRVLPRRSVRRGSFDAARPLIRHIEAYIAEWNGHPTSFVDKRLDEHCG